MSATTPEDPKGSQVVAAITGLIMLGGAIYLIYLGIKLFTL